MIGRGVEYDKRKPMLQQYALDWRLERSLNAENLSDVQKCTSMKIDA